MMLMHRLIVALLKSVTGDDSRSTSLDIFHLKGFRLHMGSTEKLGGLITAKSSFVKDPTNPASFVAFIYYASAKKVLGEISTVFIHCRKVHTDELTELLNNLMFNTGTTSNTSLQIFLGCTRLHNRDQRPRKEV